VLDRLLGILTAGGIHTPDRLASQLGVSEQLVDQMLADLSRMGYLRSISSATYQALPDGETGACADCALAGTCSAGEPEGRVWALTQKAFR